MDKASDAIRPYLQPITRELPAPIHQFVITQLGPACHKSLVLDINLGAHECLKLAVSKVLGLAIIGASSIVKVPQLLKLLNSQSAAGLSFLSYLLETASYTITLAYNVRHGFPFSTYGETAFIAVQDVAISVLILVFSGRSTYAAAFIGALAAFAYALFAGGDAAHPSQGLVDMSMLGYLQVGAGIMSVASKVPQIWTVYQEGGTGVLSAFAVFNYLAGSLTRIYTTLQEVNDPLILYSFVAGFILNAVLAAQMVYYWNSPVNSKASAKKLESGEKLAIGSSTGSSPSKSKGPTTRRRG